MENNQVPKRKVVFIGDTQVGKTSIVTRIQENVFNPDIESTIGIDFLSHKFEFNNGDQIRLQMWDTAGVERFRSLIPSYIKNSAVAVVIYDISQNKSFENVDKWCENVFEMRGEECQIIIIGNKIDLENKRAVSTQEGKEKSSKFKSLFYEISAKTGENFEQIIEGIAKLAFNSKENN